MPFDSQNYTFPDAPTLSPVENDGVLRTLIGARALLSVEGHWCKDGPGDQRVTFCMATAIRRSALGGVDALDDYQLWVDTQNFLSDVAGVHSIPDLNDNPGMTHAKVTALFDRAISSRRAALSNVTASQAIAAIEGVKK